MRYPYLGIATYATAAQSWLNNTGLRIHPWGTSFSFEKLCSLFQCQLFEYLPYYYLKNDLNGAFRLTKLVNSNNGLTELCNM